ncbi:F0F1 ATP synthase subunit delta [Haloactinopolyspora alba]|nr:F0F1 ATP synthase subunit delta [Haloactinopolyspora alba]
MQDREGHAHDELQQRVVSIVSDAQDRASEVGDALFSVAGFLVSRPSVRRALTDTGRAPEDRESFIRGLIADQVDAAAVDVVAACARERWSGPGELSAAVEEFGVLAHLLAARFNGRLDTVEEEIFRFGQVVRGDRELRSALLNTAAPVESLRTLVRTLVEGKAVPETTRLVEYAVTERRMRSLEAQLEHIMALAAKQRERRIAVAHVAAPLSPQQRERLERNLAERAGGPVLLNVVVEPGLVGGVRVEFDDEVVDGTVTSRIDAARRRLAVGM